MYSPTRHWVLVGEIMEVNFFIRPRVTIKTQYGEMVLVNFHLDTPTPSFFTWEDLKPKRTLAIFYAENRTFMDLSKGVRQESARTAMVFPCPLDCLSGELEGFLSAEKSAKACFYCGKLGSEDHKLWKCIRCRHVFYCGKNCQSPHWTKTPKSLCKYAPILANLSKLNFSRFDDFVDWSFPTIVSPTDEEKKEKAKKVMREALYNMGVAPTRGSMHSLDIQEFSFETLLLERLCIKEENIIRRGSSEGTHERACYSCGEIKSEESFSNTQRRRYGNKARCRERVSLSTL